MKKIVLLSLISFASIQSYAQKLDEVEMFPKPEFNKEQKVIKLKPLENESDYMVELLIGKSTVTDACNNYFLMGKLEEKNLEGWGYNYYNFESDGNVATTLMGCMNNSTTEKVVYAETLKVRYNSRLPIVVYVPKGFVVNYKLWNTDSKIYSVK